MDLLSDLQWKLYVARTRDKSVCVFPSAEEQSIENVYVKKETKVKWESLHLKTSKKS